MSKESLQLILTRYNDWDAQLTKEDYIDKLETFISECNERMVEIEKTGVGEPLVPDSIYDTCILFLRELKPDSELLHKVWSADGETSLDEDLDIFLREYPMMSIQTIKSYSDKFLKAFKEKLPIIGTQQVIASLKLNGHGVRVVWKDGHLVRAFSRGSTTNGLDRTKQMRIILGDYCEEFADMGLVEMRGEVLLPISNLEKARIFNPGIKSAFTGVSSMIRESATPEETKLLDVLFYDILTHNIEFETLSQKLDFIADVGFKVPIHFISTTTIDTLESDIEDMLHEMDLATQGYDYYSDGVVYGIDDIATFQKFGSEDKFRLGNMALKMGKWKQDSYSGVVGEIKWKEGKTKDTPVAVLREPVMTANGTEVTNIPLYAPCYILLLEAYPNRVINFHYGGEAGVIPVTSDGLLVTDIDFSVDLSDLMS